MKHLLQIITNSNLASDDFGGLSKYKEQLSKILQKVDNPTIEIPNSWNDVYMAISELSENERRTLTVSLFTSYYTPKALVETIVNPLLSVISKTIEHPLSVLDPSAGNGAFLKPFIDSEYNFNNHGTFTGIEKEFTAFNQLEKSLLDFESRYQSIYKPIHAGFEDTFFEKPFDLIVSNIPFGSIKIHDPNFNYNASLYEQNIQNYFFLKALNLAKPGGIISFICSRNFADSIGNTTLKETVFKSANLIGAVRLDNTMFAAEKTSVTTDLIILQKASGVKTELSTDELDFINVENSGVDAEKELFISSYYIKNPSRILGKLATNFFHNTVNLTVTPTYSFSESLDRLQEFIIHDMNSIHLLFFSKAPVPFQLEESKNKITSKKENDISQLKKVDDKLQLFLEDKYPNVINGNLVLYNQKAGIIVKENDSYFFTALKNQKNVALLSAVISIRDLYKSILIAKQADQRKEALTLQQELQYQYQLFSFQYGFLNEPHISKLFRADYDMPLLTSLEFIDDNGSYIAADILLKPIEFEKIAHQQLDDIPTVIANSYNQFNNINLEYISNTLNQNTSFWLAKALEDELIFINPIFDVDDNFVSLELCDKNKFISGYVNAKLNYFSNTLMPSVVKQNKGYSIDCVVLLNDTILKSIDFLQSHIELLNQINPKKLTISEIDPGLGESFVPLSLYEKFSNEFFEVENCKIHYFEHKDIFVIKGVGSYKTRSGFLFSKQRGSVDWKEILAHGLSQHYPSYYYYTEEGIDGKKIRVFDKELTSNVHFKIDELNAAFSKWIQHDKNIGYSNYLEKVYYKKNTAQILQSFSADYLTFKGLNPKYIPHLHQKNCVAKQLVVGGGIVDHKVGYGKTLSAALINQKRKELKIGHKSLFVCMNANYIKISEELRDYFPDAKVLLLKNTDFSKNKDKYLYQIANFEWDMVVVPHSIIERFPTDLKIDHKLLSEELFIISETLEAHNTSSNPLLDRRSYTSMVKKQVQVEADLLYLQSKLEKRRSSGYLSFDDLGFKHIVIDESHEFKNLPFHTKHSRVSGLGNALGAKKARILLSLCRSIQSHHKADKGVTFLSGTTLSNSLVELYNIFRYLRPLKMKEMKFNSLDQWTRSYARITNEFEQSLSGEVKHKQRFRWFVKTPELAKFYNEITHYADNHTFDIGAPTPEVNLHTIEPFEKQEAYFESIKKFLKTSDVSHLIGYSSNSANIVKAKGLIATSQGKKASLDMRLISPLFQEETNSKVNVAAILLQKKYVQYNNEKGTQLVFCDLGTPSSSLNFNVYQALKDNLINRGIPANEIAFIHDAKSDIQKGKLFDRVNQGVIRIVIGSTRKMGTGVNMQQRVVHMLDLDIPYRPSDLEQRWGRGARPGNLLASKVLNNKIPTTILAVKNSIDAYLFNLLALKQNFIKQFKNANLTSRSIDFGVVDDSGNMNFSNYLLACAPDSLLPQKMKLENTISEVLLRKTSFDSNRTDKKQQIRNFSKQLENVSNDLEHYKSNKNDFNNYDQIDIVIDKISHKMNKDHHKIIGDLMLKRFNNQFKRNDKPFLLASFSNGYVLNVQVYRDFFQDDSTKNKKYNLVLNDDKGYSFTYKNAVVSKDSNKNALYALNAFQTIEDKITNSKDNIDKYKNYIKQTSIEINKSFPLEKELMKLEKELFDITEKLNKQEDKTIENSIKETETQIKDTSKGVS